MNPLICPSCNGHEWPADTHGRYVCPQCRANVAIWQAGARHSTAGIKVLTVVTLKRPVGPSVTPVDRLYRVIRPSDGRIHCAMCARPTDTLTGIDGRIDLDERSAMRVKVNERYVPADTLIPEHETRILPTRRVRGVICPDCAARYGAQPVRQQGKQRKLKWIVGNFPHFNRAWQNQDMRAGLANWSRGAWDPKRWIAYGDPSWMGLTIESLVEQSDGSLVIEAHQAKHPRLCPCTICLHTERADMLQVPPHPNRVLYRGPLASTVAVVRPPSHKAVSVGIGHHAGRHTPARTIIVRSDIVDPIRYALRGYSASWQGLGYRPIPRNRSLVRLTDIGT